MIQRELIQSADDHSIVHHSVRLSPSLIPADQPSFSTLSASSWAINGFKAGPGRLSSIE
jgi:hypothetical protein